MCVRVCACMRVSVHLCVGKGVVIAGVCAWYWPEIDLRHHRSLSEQMPLQTIDRVQSLNWSGAPANNSNTKN